MKIPWKPEDAKKHKKGLSKEQQKKWAKIANSVYNDCMKEKGGSDSKCAPKAIRIANSKVGGNKNQEGDEMKTKKMQVPKEGFRLFTDEPSIDFAEKDENGFPVAFSMNAYTGSVMPALFDGSIAVDVAGIDFSGKRRFPILEQHDVSQKIGVSNAKPSTDGNRVFFERIDILNNEVANEFKQNLKDNFPYQASISVKPLKIEEVPQGESSKVNDMSFKGPGVIIRSSKFREASVCVFGRDDKTSVKSLSEEDCEEMDVELIDVLPDTKKRKPNGGKSMKDLAAIKEDFPELHDKLQKDLNDLNTQITNLTSENETLKQEKTDLETQVNDLTQEKETLSEKDKQNEARIVKLEKDNQIRTQKDLQTQAMSIVDHKLSDSRIPKRLYSRVKKQIDHNEFVDDKDVLDVEKFKESVDTEINSWIEDLGADETTAQILGISGSNDHNATDEYDSDKLSDELVAFSTGPAAK